MTKGPDPILVLKQFGRDLQGSNPKAWDGFVSAFDVYCMDVTVAVSRAPTDVILEAKGRALQMQEVLKTLNDLNLPQHP